ncbi:MAG TPA: hypothetical protein VHR86_02755, partial [Armatimonadota bacterium]|nr:hypothetical protein [Armatimonadota bacterium]
RDRAEQPTHTRPALLSVWLRNINQYESSMDWRGSNWHGLSAALERGHYEYDVTDTTDLLRRLPEYRVVEYACNESPAGMMAQLRHWVTGKKDRALITHSVVPTRVMEGIHYCRFWEDVLFLQHPELGKTLGIGQITAARATGEQIDAVDPALRPYFRVGESLPVPAERFVAQGAKTLLQVGGQPLVQMKQISNGGRIFFLTYRAGRKDVPTTTEDRITAALMALLHVTPEFKAPQRLIAHTYQLAPGQVAALFDRECFDAFSKENGSGKELLRLSAPETDLSCSVRVPNGLYRIYDLLHDRELCAEAVGGTLTLRLQGASMGIFYYGQDTPAWQARLAKIRAARQTVAPYLLGASS